MSQKRLGLRQFLLERSWINGNQKISCFNILPFFEMKTKHTSSHLWRNSHRIKRNHTAYRFDLNRHITSFRPTDHY